MRISSGRVPIRLIQTSIAAFFFIGVALPIIRMFQRITPESIAELRAMPQFFEATVNSLTTGLLSTFASITLALSCAWCLERTSIPLKSFFRIALTAPMLIPSISHAFGLVTLLGANGILTSFFGFSKGIYGFSGIVAGSVMYSFPVALLMFTSILRYEDGSAYQAADVLGISKFRQFTAITLPYLRKTLISAAFAVFTMVVTDYGVPLMIGGNQITLSVLMYNRAVGLLDYGQGSAIGALLLVPAIVAFIADVVHPEQGQSAFVTTPIKPVKRRVKDVAGLIFCALLAICVILPLVAFCVMTFETKYPVNPAFSLYHIEKTLNRGAGVYLRNSLLYALGTGCFGAFIAFLCAYLTARVKGRVSKALHLLSLVSMAIPGMVLGLSYVVFFSGRAIYGTIFMIMLVNTIHFFSSPYLMMYNTLVKVNQNFEAVGLSLGISRLRIVIDVILPKIWGTVAEMFSYFFVNSMMTISAVSFLAPPSPKPIALMINQFEAQLLMESAAFVSVMILIVNLSVKGIFACVSSKQNSFS